MTIEFKDYYEVLGIDKDASEQTIRKAYRSLARQFHPDVAKDKSGAELRFKEINEANEVLGDPQKRRQFDELGENWNHPERQGSGQAGPSHGFTPDDPGFQADGTGFSDFFEQFFASNSRPDSGFRRTSAREMAGESVPRRGRDLERDILVTLEEILHGGTRTIRLQRTDRATGKASTQTLRVKIPSGVREAQLIRLAGKGEEGTGGGDAGHLYLRVKFAKHPDLRVRGANLYYDLLLSPWEAVLGTNVQIPTIDGTVTLKVPPGTMAEREFRLRGKGLPSEVGAPGDLHAVVSIEVPGQQTPEETALWEQLASASTFNPRSAS